MLSTNPVSPGAVWSCKHCRLWWGSQVGKRPSTNFLVEISKAGFLPYDWDAYRGWKKDSASARNCPQCQREISLPALQFN